MVQDFFLQSVILFIVNFYGSRVDLQYCVNFNTYFFQIQLYIIVR